MNCKWHRDSTKLHFPAEINTNEIVSEDLSASLDRVTTAASTKGSPFIELVSTGPWKSDIIFFDK